MTESISESIFMMAEAKLVAYGLVTGSMHAKLVMLQHPIR